MHQVLEQISPDIKSGDKARSIRLVNYLSREAIRLNADLDNNVDDFIVHIMSGEGQGTKAKEAKEIARLWQECALKDEILLMTRKRLKLRF